MGGSVFWAGKPHPNAYATAVEIASRLRETAIERARILAIGDALRTDLKAAESAGIDALFIAAGIHRHETMTGEAIDPERLKALFAPGAPPAIGAMAYLSW